MKDCYCDGREIVPLPLLRWIKNAINWDSDRAFVVSSSISNNNV